MDDKIKLRKFLAELHRFLPEKTIYVALSSLPEDIFDNEDALYIPSFGNDKEVQEFIRDNGFDEPENIINFFMEQYFANLEEMLKEMFADMDTNGENIICNSIHDDSYDYEYMSVFG